MKGIITDPFGSSLRNLKSQSSLDEQQTKHSNKLLLTILSLTTTQRMHIKIWEYGFLEFYEDSSGNKKHEKHNPTSVGHLHATSKVWNSTSNMNTEKNVILMLSKESRIGGPNSCDMTHLCHNSLQGLTRTMSTLSCIPWKSISASNFTIFLFLAARNVPTSASKRFAHLSSLNRVPNFTCAHHKVPQNMPLTS